MLWNASWFKRNAPSKKHHYLSGAFEREAVMVSVPKSHKAFRHACVDRDVSAHSVAVSLNPRVEELFSMVIGTSAIVFAAAAAVGVVFAFARPADARFIHQCSGKYHAAAKAGCRADPPKARAPRPRGITLGIGDLTTATVWQHPGGRL